MPTGERCRKREVGKESVRISGNPASGRLFSQKVQKTVDLDGSNVLRWDPGISRNIPGAQRAISTDPRNLN